MGKSITPADLQALIGAAAVPGLSMAVVRRGEPPALTQAGVRNATTGQSVDTGTIFDAASLSKPVFAYAVLQLVDAGMLSLDTPLAQLWPDYVADDSRVAAIKVRHVLSHSPGLPNWRSADAPLKTHFAPGERFSYSVTKRKKRNMPTQPAHAKSYRARQSASAPLLTSGDTLGGLSPCQSSREFSR